MSVTHAITRPLSAGYGGIDFCDGCEVRLASGEWPSELCASCCDSLAARQMTPHRVKRVPAQAKKRQGTRIDGRDNVPSSDGQRRPENPSRDHAAAVGGARGKTLSAARNHGRHEWDRSRSFSVPRSRTCAFGGHMVRCHDRSCPICKTPMNGRQTSGCSGKCRTALSRLKQQAAEMAKDQAIDQELVKAAVAIQRAREALQRRSRK